MTSTEFPDLTARTAGIQVEAKLREWNLSYEYVAEFQIEKLRAVDWTQVRHERETRETVAEFRTQIVHGAVFPPIVIYAPNVLADGNHRVAAFRGLGRKYIPAFIVNFPSADLVKAFNAAVNQQNGRRLSAHEARAAAETMMARGMANEAIAREIGHTVSHVKQIRTRIEFAKRVAELPEIQKLMEERPLPERHQLKLAQIKHTAPLAEAIKLVHETKADTKVVKEVVDAIAGAQSDADAVTIIKAKRAELAPAGPAPGRVIIPQAVRMARLHVAALVKFHENPPALLDTSSDETRQRAAGQWKQLRDLADEMTRLYSQ